MKNRMTRLLWCNFLWLVVANASYACDVAFENFNKTYCLTPGDNGFYLVSGVYPTIGKPLKVALSDRVIVRAAGFTKDSLQTLDPRIVSVSELYLMPEANYYSVTLSARHQISSVMSMLNRVPGVSLVQPDILQLAMRTDAKHTDIGRANPENFQTSTLKSAPYLSQLDIPRLWKTTRGHGVNIAVIDDGFALQHEELRFADVLFSYDAERRTQDVSPQSELDIHGTKVIGTIFAAHDGRGIDGIAPEASLIAIRQPTTWTSSTLLSFYLSKLSDADIVNASWNSQWLLEPLADIVSDLARNGRSGKGTVVVFSAGNGGAEQTPMQTMGSSEASLLDAVVVGSDDGTGHRTRFSNYGNSVDAYLYGKPVPALVPGGYGRFSGTSLSTAIASGYFALVLADTPSLTLNQLVQRLSAQLRTGELNND